MLRITKHSLLTTTTVVMCISTLALSINSTWANPKGGQVVSGEATITQPNTTTVEINQSSQNAIVDWQRFDIAPNETTRFIQPNSNSWILNRVVGSFEPTAILGTIQANGNVAVVNPDGIIFGHGSRVDVNSLIATTSNISNNNFMAGRMLFDIPGNPAASVINEGDITIADYGLAAFVAPGVRNSGVITARFGSVSLAAGNKFTLDLYGDGLINLVADDEIIQEVFDIATGKPMLDLVKNDGKISANGGLVALKAATARRAVNSVINNTGIIEANTIGIHKGKIILGAQTASTKMIKPSMPAPPPQRVKISGTLNAYAPITRVTLPKGRPLFGGNIELTGEWIDLVDATLNVYGTNGGGTVLIGGDYMGGNGNPATIAQHNIQLENKPVATATYVSASAGTTINADAIENGNGGKVILWSNNTTNTAATISARGGSKGGNGGFIETSGKQKLHFNKGSIDASAKKGRSGLWLLDPENITLDTSVLTSLNNGTSVHLLATDTISANQQFINKSTGGDASITLEAGNKISFLDSELSSTSGKLNVALKAPNIDWSTGNIQSNGGSVSIRADGKHIVNNSLALDAMNIITAGGAVEIWKISSTNSDWANLNVGIKSGTGNVTIGSDRGIRHTGTIETYDSSITYTARSTIDLNSALWGIDAGGSTTGVINSSRGNIYLGGGTSNFGIGNGNFLVQAARGDVHWNANFTSTGGNLTVDASDEGWLGIQPHSSFVASQNAANFNFEAGQIYLGNGFISTNGGNISFAMRNVVGNPFVTAPQVGFNVQEFRTSGGDISIDVYKGPLSNFRIGNSGRGGIFTGGGDLAVSAKEHISATLTTTIDLGGGTATFSGSSVGFCTLCSLGGSSNPALSYNSSAWINLGADGITDPGGVDIQNGTLKVVINGIAPTRPVPTPTDTPPTAGAGDLNDITFTNDGTWTGSGVLTDLFDDDGGTTNLDINVTGHPSGIQYSVSNGQINFSLIPGANIQSGNYLVTVKATDSSGQAVTRQFNFKIEAPVVIIPPTPVDNPPTNGVGSLEDITFTNDGTWTGSGTVDNLFIDDNGYGTNLVITETGLPSGISLQQTANGGIQLSLVSTQQVQSGQYTVRLTATDASGNTTFRTFHLNIIEPQIIVPTPVVDLPPQVSGTPFLPIILEFGQAHTIDHIDPTQYFTDDAGSGALTFRMIDLPQGITFSPNTQNSFYNIAQIQNGPLPGTYTSKLIATDTSGQSKSITVSVIVNERPPVTINQPVDLPNELFAGVFNLENANSTPSRIQPTQIIGSFENLKAAEKDKIFISALLVREVYDISSSEYSPIVSTASSSGFKAKAYLRNGEILIVFSGTDGPDALDWINNGQQLFSDASNSIQYQEAKGMLSDVLIKLKIKGYHAENRKIALSGHSLGGGLAQYAALTSVVPIDELITFNSAGLSDQTLNTIPSTSFRKNLWNASIIHVVSKYDPVSKFGSHVPGQTISVNAGSALRPLNSHSMTTLINAMGASIF